jgi:pseudouridine kinase
MKQGFMQMSKMFDVAVIGTIFVDIKGFPKESYHALGRNLGQVHFYHGGVGRNVVETMAQLDTKTAFVSTVDQSGLGQEVLERLQSNGIDITYVPAFEKEGMGMWMAILDERGDLAGSISQMPSLEIMEPTILGSADQFLSVSKAVVLEIDLNEKIAETIVEKTVERGLPLYGIPGNLDVLNKRLDLLEHFQCFICNEIEAEKLTSITLESEESIKKAAKFLTSSGLKQVVITLGPEGSYYYDAQTDQGAFQKAMKVDVVDTTGAGDSFFAGTISGLLKGESLAKAVELGTVVAGWTISSPESTCQDLAEKLAKEEVR